MREEGGGIRWFEAIIERRAGRRVENRVEVRLD